ncbi:MAG: GTP-binding protein [Candidatus Altiarchaeales archaeon]|nr:GTP-binding protein [Candidatus Altiarchaeales archaeon]MBD3415774.1 GTP-binding protein [Candidatus Altiarchaeales archaeon]
MMRVLLMGNPNVGKSALFSRLTGVHVMCSNYPGTTVSYCTGRMKYGGEMVELVDVPGTYALTAENPAEKAASEMLPEGDVVIDVVDATNLERNLYLTLQVLESGKPTVVALNMSDDARHLGVEVDVDDLERSLGVPVVETVAVTGEGVKRLVDRLSEARTVGGERSDEERWKEVGHIVSKVQKLHEKDHTFTEALEDATIKPLTGIPIALAVLFLMFSFIINTGNFIIENVLDPFFIGVYGPLVRGLVEGVFPSGMMHEILLGSGEDFIESLGVLTTGVYVPLDMVLPFVVLFYLALSFLEDVGYLPRLATLMDNLMHRIGLHGSAIVPTILGLGCNVPGVLSTRILETKKQRFISATLMALCIPCLAQNAVIIGLLSRYGLRYIAITYATLLALYVVVGLALNRFIPGESPEILLEVPPYRRPDPRSLLKKTWVRVKYFITDAVPYVLLGVLAVNLTYVTGVVSFIAGFFGPVMGELFGLPEEAAIALIVGFLRKDVAVGMLAPLGMSAEQLTIASTILAIYFPCIATFTVLYRELGLKDLLKSMALMVVVTVVVGASLKAVLL